MEKETCLEVLNSLLLLKKYIHKCTFFLLYLSVDIDIVYGRIFVHVCVCVCACACVRACVHS